MFDDLEICNRCSGKLCQKPYNFKPILVKFREVDLFCPARVESTLFAQSWGGFWLNDIDFDLAILDIPARMAMTIAKMGLDKADTIRYLISRNQVVVLKPNPTISEGGMGSTGGSMLNASSSSAAGSPRTSAWANDDMEKVKGDPLTAAAPAPAIKVTLSAPSFEEKGVKIAINEVCYVKVSASTSQGKPTGQVTFKLFSLYKGQEEDMNVNVNAPVKNGIARAEVKLWINSAYHQDKEKRPTDKVEYYFKALHPNSELPAESHKLTLCHINKAHFVKAPDKLFNLNSAIPCLDNDSNLLFILTGIFKFAGENKDNTMILFGHTDTSGEIEPNYKLSELRARAMKSLLDKDSGAFADIAKAKSTVKDYQVILNALTENHGWSCDTGTADNQSGPQTEAGVKNFQAEYNSRYSASIGVDGKFGPQSWKAVFRVLWELLEEAWENAGARTPLPALKYGYSGKGWYACGESFPIAGEGKDAYKSKTNRRVEAIFFSKGKEPKLEQPSSANQRLTAKECPVYDDGQWEREAVEVRPAPFIQKGTVVEINCRNKIIPLGDVVALISKDENPKLLAKQTIKKEHAVSNELVKIPFEDLPDGSSFNVEIQTEDGKLIQFLEVK
jgi:outer membrane protein OmpA-like peptidoglycan-associated protein